jgi:hypothetical protein
MRAGSFQVFRRLRQDVAGWWNKMDQLSDGDATAEDVAARAIGRRLDGTPLAPGACPGDHNEFNYDGDEAGAHTPRYAHIRKMNPRHDEMFRDRSHKLLRRGVPYGPPMDRRNKGAPWPTGMTLDGKPFDPDGPLDRLAEVRNEDGAPGLDAPEPETVVLDWMFDMPRESRTVAFPGDDEGRYLMSIPYWNPARAAGKPVSTTVEYSATHRVEWAKSPQSSWVAVSFDAFWPKTRDSADILIPLGDCDGLCPTDR